MHYYKGKRMFKKIKSNMAPQHLLAVRSRLCKLCDNAEHRRILMRTTSIRGLNAHNATLHSCPVVKHIITKKILPLYFKALKRSIYIEHRNRFITAIMNRVINLNYFSVVLQRLLPEHVTNNGEQIADMQITIDELFEYMYQASVVCFNQIQDASASCIILMANEVINQAVTKYRISNNHPILFTMHTIANGRLIGTYDLVLVNAFHYLDLTLYDIFKLSHENK